MADIARISRGVVDLNVRLTRSSLDDFAKFAEGADRSMTGEIFYLNHRPTEQVIRGMADRGIDQRYLLDPEEHEPVSQLLDEVGATWNTYGEIPFKNHAKGFVRDVGGNAEAFITTGAFTPITASRLEFVASFKGDAARALHGVIDAGIGGDVKTMRAAAQEASRFGIVVNDSMAGVTYLTDSIFDMVRTARREIVVSTKIFSDPRIVKLVDEAAARGVKVRFSDIRSEGMHGNLLVADDAMYFGTAHFSPRSLANGQLAYRKARDVGMVVQDKDAIAGVLGTMDREGMPVYLADEFAQSRAHFQHMEAVGKYEDKLDELEAAGTPITDAQRAKLAELEQASDEATEGWRALTSEVQDRRAADGITFSSPAEGVPLDPRAVGFSPAVAISGAVDGAREMLSSRGGRLAAGGVAAGIGAGTVYATTRGNGS